MRQNKQPFLLFTKHEEKKQWFHCSKHRGVRLIRTDKGFLCPEGCGYTIPAIKIVDTVPVANNDSFSVTLSMKNERK